MSSSVGKATPLQRHGKRTPFLFLLPALLVYGLFVLTPVGEAFRLSLYSWPTAASQPVYAALGNFRALLDDEIFWSALRHNALLLVSR